MKPSRTSLLHFPWGRPEPMRARYHCNGSALAVRNGKITLIEETTGPAYARSCALAAAKLIDSSPNQDD